LVTGMLWGYVAWNTPFRLEPRLVSTLILWLIFLAFSILRVFGDPQKVAAHSAVLGILGALTVPVVVYSVKLLPQFSQLHPQVVAQQGLRDPSFYDALAVSSVALILLQFYLVWLRKRIA